MTGFARTPTAPERCGACRGTGKVSGVCMPLVCLECDGVGWVPTDGQDLAEQLGHALTRALARLRIYGAAGTQFGPELDYQDNGRGGQRGNWTGD